MTQLVTTVVVQMDDGKVYLPPIRIADYPNIHPMTEEEWQAQNVVAQENL